MENCFFCDCLKETSKIVFENELAYARYDIFPVSDGHMLIMTKRHVKDFFGITKEEQMAMFELVEKCKKLLDAKYHPDGYNIGMNCGEAAGQSVMHVHIHLIPRYFGDEENPRGGVRGVIASRKDYCV